MKLIPLILFAISAFAQFIPFPGPGRASTGSSWTFSTTVTLDHTKVPATQTSFPVMFRSPVGTVTTIGTAVTLSAGDQFPTWMAGRNIMINGVVYAVSIRVSGTVLTLGTSAGTQASPVAYCGTPEFATVANGGKATNASGFDVVPFTDSVGVTKYDFERERYVAATGEVIDWFRQGSLSSSVDTSVFYLTGNSGVTTDQSNKTAVWDTNYKQALHVPNGTSLTTLDSTSNAQNGTVVGGVVATAGQMDGGASFPNFPNTGDSIDVSAINLGTAFTVQAWVKPATGSAASATFIRIAENLFSTGFYLGKAGSGGAQYQLIVNNDFTLVGGTLADGVWAWVVGTFDGTTATLYVNGTSVGTPTTPGTPTVGSHIIKWGINSSAASEGWGGIMDELRLSTTARSANWITTEFNNQNAPFTFFSMAANVAH